MTSQNVKDKHILVVEDIKHNHVQVNSEWFEVCEFVEYFISFLRYSV